MTPCAGHMQPALFIAGNQCAREVADKRRIATGRLRDSAHCAGQPPPTVSGHRGALAGNANADRLRYPWDMGRAEILKAALELPAAEREQLADDLWASLHGETEAQVEQAWAAE